MHRVKAGQAAEIRVEAFPDLRLTGKVTRVGTLAATSPTGRSTTSGSIWSSRSIRPTAELRPEMSIRADVIVGTRTNVLMVPVTAVFNNQGTRVVYVAGATGTEMRPVDLGESNDRMVEIVAGLREGERVSLSAPARAGAEYACPRQCASASLSSPSSCASRSRRSAAIACARRSACSAWCSASPR